MSAAAGGGGGSSRGGGGLPHQDLPLGHPGLGAPGAQILMWALRMLPAEVIHDPRGFSVRCAVPNRLVGGLLGHGGAVAKEVRDMTGARIDIPPSATDFENRAMSITGPLMSVVSAYVLMMRQYVETERAHASGQYAVASPMQGGDGGSGCAGGTAGVGGCHGGQTWSPGDAAAQSAGAWAAGCSGAASQGSPAPASASAAGSGGGLLVAGPAACSGQGESTSGATALAAMDPATLNGMEQQLQQQLAQVKQMQQQLAQSAAI